MRKEGITLDEFSCLAICNGSTATTVRHGESDLDQLRALVTECSGRMGKVLVFSYDQQGVGQAGAGHFSPLGGYNAAEDLVLVLDTARFKYPPHWVKLDRLYAAMEAPDASTGRPRGYIRGHGAGRDPGVGAPALCGGLDPAEYGAARSSDSKVDRILGLGLIEFDRAPCILPALTPPRASRTTRSFPPFFLSVHIIFHLSQR